MNGGTKMKPCYKNVEWLIDENGNMFGINLGWDFVAEHGGNPRGIMRKFGVPLKEDVFGIEKRIITQLPGGLTLKKTENKEKKMVYVLYYHFLNSEERYEEHYKNKLPWGLSIYGEKDLSTAWYGDGFGIAVRKNHKKYLEEIYEAFQRKDIALGISGSKNPFANSGFTITIASKVPQDIKDVVCERDKAEYELLTASKETGIHKLLEEKGKRYFALGPKWKEKAPNHLPKTKEKVVYFLNPYDQQKYNHGWYTVEQLIQWTEEKGPIIKKV